MIASSTIANDVTGFAEGVPASVADLIGTVKERLPDSRPDIPLPEISLSELASRLPQLRRPDIDVSELASRLPQLRLPDVDVGDLAERLRELPAVGAALPKQRSMAARVVVGVAVAGVAVGTVLMMRRKRAHRNHADQG